VAFVATGFACPPLADNFIYGLKPVELRRNIKLSQQNKSKQGNSEDVRPSVSQNIAEFPATKIDGL